MKCKIGVVFVLTGLYLVGCNVEKDGGLKMEIEKLVKNEIKVGMNAVDVEQVLERHDIEYSYQKREELEAFSVSPNNDEVLHPDAVGRYLGVVRHIKTDGLVTESLSIMVDMDGQKRVVDVSTKRILTGP